MFKTRIRRKAFTLGARAVRYAKTHKMEMLQLSIMATIVLLPDTSFAQEVKTSSSFDVVNGPLEELQKYATGKFAKGAATLGLIAGGGSFMVNSENQIVKRSMQAAGAGGFLVAVPTVVDTVFGFVIP